MKSRVLTTIVCFGLSAAAAAQVTVTDPWVRATVPEQKATGAFMRLQSTEDARLVDARSPVAGVVELHETVMERGIARMRAVPAIAISAHGGAELKPGGYHVMLMQLKQQVKESETVPITLVVEGKDGKRQTIEVRAPVRPLKTAAHAPMKHKH